MWHAFRMTRTDVYNKNLYLGVHYIIHVHLVILPARSSQHVQLWSTTPTFFEFKIDSLKAWSLAKNSVCLFTQMMYSTGPGPFVEATNMIFKLEDSYKEPVDESDLYHQFQTRFHFSSRS